MAAVVAAVMVAVVAAAVALIVTSPAVEEETWPWELVARLVVGGAVAVLGPMVVMDGGEESKDCVDSGWKASCAVEVVNCTRVGGGRGHAPVGTDERRNKV